jgi:hypothetical protein
LIARVRAWYEARRVSNESGKVRSVVAVAALAIAGVAAWLWLARSPARPVEPAPEPIEVAAAPPVEAPAPVEPDPAELEPERHPPLALDDEPTPAFESIDLEAAREALPDNLYWETGAPTQDPRLLGDRERAAKHWNEQYGKILSGTATEAEIEAFFDHRMRLSSDSVRFVDWVIEHQGGEISEQDLTLLHVAKRLHLARLAEVPKRMQEALDRKAEQDAARAAWLAEEAELEAAAEAGDADTGDATDR